LEIELEGLAGLQFRVCLRFQGLELLVDLAEDLALLLAQEPAEGAVVGQTTDTGFLAGQAGSIQSGEPDQFFVGLSDFLQRTLEQGDLALQCADLFHVRLFPLFLLRQLAGVAPGT